MENKKFYDIFKTEKERFINEKIDTLKKDKYNCTQIEDYFDSKKFILDYVQNSDRFISEMVSTYINDSLTKNTTTKKNKVQFLNHINDIYSKSFN